MYNDPVQHVLIELLLALYKDLTHGPTDDRFRSILVHYIVLSSIKPTGQWRTPSDITPKIAGILFIGRVTFGSTMLQMRSARPNLMYDQ